MNQGRWPTTNDNLAMTRGLRTPARHHAIGQASPRDDTPPRRIPLYVSKSFKDQERAGPLPNRPASPLLFDRDLDLAIKKDHYQQQEEEMR